MAPDSIRTTDRPTSLQYTMKTSPLSHHNQNARHLQNNLNLQSFRSNRASTPMLSPSIPHSVGQAYTPGVKPTPTLLSDARTPSPNYFGLSMEGHGDLGNSVDAPLHHNWSSQNSSVKSFDAAIPKQVPLDANPEFEAFKRQVDANKANGPFNLAGSYFPPSSTSSRPHPPRRTTNQSDAASDHSIARSVASKSRDPPGGALADADADSLHDSAYVSSDSKRNSEASLYLPSFSMPRFESPATSDSPFDSMRVKGPLARVDDRHTRLSLPYNKPDSPVDSAKTRADTVPSSLENGDPVLFMPNELKHLLDKIPESEYLILDVRVATLYAQARIRGALNLCIPTTLLKRATFDLQKLQKTLQTEEDQAKFSQWSKVKYLIIYDHASCEKRDALAAMNMSRKFMNEGLSNRPYLLKGGFQAFAAAYPTSVDHQSAAERGGTSVASSQGGRPGFAPVIGGVALPTTTNIANPFFSNIRQNIDLADGVGQMDIAVPPNLDSEVLPLWLRDATQKADHGKKVSDRFLKIERNEQSRMKDAYASFNAPTPAGSKSGRVQLCGVEKGGKNRYKDILPFEHARVRLSGQKSGACDYINASFVQATRSHKRYIASQGPLPATFNDFWSVVWDQDVRVIVMLTAEEEGGQLKCHPYWRGREFGPITLKPLSEKKVSLDIDKYMSPSPPSDHQESGRRRASTTTTLASSTNPPPQQSQARGDGHYVIIRKFAMSHAAHPFAPIREITHLHYPSWPDFGTPAQPSHLLALVELANVMQRSALPVDAGVVAASVAGEHPSTMSWHDEPESDAKARPLLVHCSAGCGRTGTFCTVDSVIDMLKRQRLASLAKRQRQDMEGDVFMNDEASSPKKARHGDYSEDLAVSIKGVDAGWVGETGLDLIEATVEDFRKQRLSMVQSLRQFVLCYESITEWVWRLQETNNGGANNRGRLRSGSLRGSR